MFETAGMVEMEMTDNDGFDVLDIVAGGFDGSWEFHLFRVLRTWEDLWATVRCGMPSGGRRAD